MWMWRCGVPPDANDGSLQAKDRIVTRRCSKFRALTKLRLRQTGREQAENHDSSPAILLF